MWVHLQAGSRPSLGTKFSERELADDLGSAALRFDCWLTDDHAWFTAEAA
jgi:hypothetical protein